MQPTHMLKLNSIFTFFICLLDLLKSVCKIWDTRYEDDLWRNIYKINCENLVPKRASNRPPAACLYVIQFMSQA